MNCDTLLNRINQVDLSGKLNVKIDKDRGGNEFILIQLWRISGAIKNDNSAKINMLVFPNTPTGDLRIYVPSLAKCEPNDFDLTIFMDANTKALYGAFRWDADDNEVHFSGYIPLPTDEDDFLSVGLLQRLLKDIYEALLWPELKNHQFSISKVDLLSDEEKHEKLSKIFEVYRRLTNPIGDDGAV